jgi:hypothetical protein
MITGLVDNRNSSLFEELNKHYEIKIEWVDHTEEYGCYSKNHQSTIYVPKTKICPASFTHELLHIYLRSKGVFIGARLKRKFQASKILLKIYSEQLSEHVGNCLDHMKMLPIYIELGFDRTKFIHDYEKHKFTNHHAEIIEKYWKAGEHYNAQIIEFYLDRYFAAKACPNDEIDYSTNLNKLKKLDKHLFQINEKLIKRWKAMEIETVSENAETDNYITIAEDYISEMKNWVKSKSII